MTLAPQEQLKRRLIAAEGYLMLNMATEAIHELGTIPHHAQDGFAFHAMMAEAARMQGDFPRALKAFDRCRAFEPNNLSVLMGLAWCYKRTDQLVRAIDAMQEAYEHHSDEPVVLYNLSCYYSLAGDKQAALSWLGRALRMHASFLAMIPSETDFDPLRADPDFIKLLELAQSKSPA